MYPTINTHRPGWTFRPGYAHPNRDRRMPCGAKVAYHVEQRWLAMWPHGEAPTMPPFNPIVSSWTEKAG